MTAVVSFFDEFGYIYIQSLKLLFGVYPMVWYIAGFMTIDIVEMTFYEWQ